MHILYLYVYLRLVRAVPLSIHPSFLGFLYHPLHYKGVVEMWLAGWLASLLMVKTKAN